MNTFGRNLKSARKNCKISQKDFAERLQTTQQRVSEWECDKVEPSLFNIIRILKVLEISFDELTEGIEKQS
ncbi:MAG: helix-turn-helix domain-containing protein [Clostridiales bacterium]|nr:helix-turn-helix domain-containing protein [Clostridiales bacterium]